MDWNEDEYGMDRGDVDAPNYNVRSSHTWIQIDENDEYGWGWICYSDEYGNITKPGIKGPVEMLKHELELLVGSE